MTKEQKSDKIKLSDLFEKQKTLFEKYNTESDMNLNINWDEYKANIYRLLKIKLLKYGDVEEKNFCQNNVVATISPDEFISACEEDKDFKLVIDFFKQNYEIY